MEIFQGYSATEAWDSAADAFAASHARSQASRLGLTFEIPQAAFVIDNPLLRWVQSRTPPANIALALAEVVWIVTGRSDTSFISAWSKSYSKYVGRVSRQHDAYGHRLRVHFGVDQLTRAAAALSNNPTTRQVVLQLWDATTDFPSKDGLPADPNIPCSVIAMLKVRDGRLEWTQILRSNDFFRGTPYNFFQFMTLQELFAGWIGVIPGTYTHISDSLHVYEQELFSIREVSRPCEIWANTDSLALEMNECLREFHLLGQAVEKISGSDEKALIDFRDDTFSEPIVNFLSIFAAERLRQLHLYHAARSVVLRCTNPYLRHAWTTWADHLECTKT